MGKSKGSKKRAQRIHAKRRAVERYGSELSNSKLNEICKSIQSNKGTFLGRSSHRTTIWEVNYNNIVYKVVYDKNRKSIVSFLPPD